MTTFVVPTNFFDPTFRERVRNDNPIADVINADLLASGHRPLAGRGDELEGWHPAHGSTSETSLKVNIAKGLWHCFNCGAGGDVFTWIMNAHKHTFVEALHVLAARAGIPLPSLDPVQQQQWQQLQQERHDLEQLFQAAAEFFHQQLTQEHVDFCKTQWGLALETLQQYKIGFAPVAPDAQQQWLRTQHFADDAIRKSGLVISVAGRWRDFFQGRIMFPYWRDLPNVLTGLPGTPLYFIGRRVEGTTPDVDWEKAKYRKQLVHGTKYPYVSPTVSNTYFYGEHAMRGVKDRPVLVTEGVADCLVALQADIPTISPVTTRFSKACHPRLLHLVRHAPRVLICNDSEESQAGTKGALATAEVLDDADVDVRLVTLPRSDGVTKVDLADFLKNHPVEDFQRLCDTAPTYLDAQLATYTVSADGFANCQTARQFVTEVLCQCRDAQKALAFLQHRVKAYFSLRNADIDDLVREYHVQGDGHAESRESEERDTPEEPYQATSQGLVWLKATKDGPVETPLTNFTATITTETVEDDGAETRLHFALTTQLQGETHSFEIPAKQFAGMGWVTDHLGATAIVMPGMIVKDHARAAIQILSKDITRRHVYTHLGWRKVAGEWVYLHAGGALGANGPVPDVEVRLDHVLARYYLQVSGSRAQAQQAIQASLRLLDLGPDAVTVPAYSALWRSLLGHVDHSLHLTGMTGSGKTTLAALLQQHFGVTLDANSLPGAWSSTGNALEGLAFLAKDALLVIDDFCPTGSTSDIQRLYRDADRVFRAGGNTSARQRMRPDGTLRPPKPPRGVILSTGEDIPPGHSLRARLLIIEVPATMLADAKAAFTTCQTEARTGLYAQALGGFVQWLAPNYEAVQQSLVQDVEVLRQAAVQAGHLRTPGIVAQLAVGFQTFLAYASDMGALSATERDALWQRGWTALNEAAARQHAYHETEDEVTRFLAALMGALAAGDAHVASTKHPGEPCEWPAWGWRQEVSESNDGAHAPRTTTTWRAQGRRLGWLDGDRLYLDPEAAYSIADQFATTQKRALTLSAQTLWKRMNERGLLKRDPSQDRNRVKRTIGSKRPSVIDIAASVFDAV